MALTNQVIVRWSPSSTALSPWLQLARTNALSAVLGHGGAHFLRRSGSGADVYQLPKALGRNAWSILGALASAPGVASVEPDLWMTADVLPNDPKAPDLWGLLNAFQGTTRSPYGIDAIGAWPTTTGSGVVVAVVDTGLLFGHPDLAGQSVAGYDMISSSFGSHDGDGRDSDAADPGDWSTGFLCPPSNSSWHGTHVAGTIAALANNNKGVFGGAPGVKVQPVRVLGRCGGSLSDVADGIRWAAGDPDLGIPANTYASSVRVISLSLGGSGDCLDGSEMATAISYARTAGKVVAVAAGNSGSNASSFNPANCPGAFTVAATGTNGKRASFSNYGSIVDIAAPGVDILSTLNSGAHGPVKYTYAEYSGTSMATPHVSLTAALVAAANPSLTPSQIEAALKSSATTFPADGTAHSCPNNCGAGIVNAAAAVAAVAQPTAPDPPTGVTAAANNGAATVHWSAPLDNGGSPITGYTATSNSGDQQCTTTGALACAVLGLTNGTAYTFTVRATNAVGNSAPSVPSGSVTPTAVSPEVDNTPPVVQAASAAIDAGHDLGATATMHVSWPAATDDSGVVEYKLERSINGGAWMVVALPSATALAANLQLGPAGSLALRLSALDGSGNWSGPTLTPASTLSLFQETQKPPLNYSGSFRRVTLSGAAGGYVKRTTVAGRSVSFAFTGSSVGWVSTLGSNRGIADIWLDGSPVDSVDLYAASLGAGEVVWATTVAPGAHTVQVIVTGTQNPSATASRVDIDGFLAY